MNLPRAKTSFRFATQVNLTQVTTRKARNLKEFLSHLKEVPVSVIYYHTHRFLKQHHFLSPEPPNDFAYWVGQALQDERLAEKLAAIDTVQYTHVSDLGKRITDTIEKHVQDGGASTREARPGDEFYFMQSTSFVLDTPYEVWDLAEFVDALKKVSIHSLYHHIFEARLRLRTTGVNDFSNWLADSLGEAKLAKSIAQMDPYTQTLEGLRDRIIRLTQKRIEEIQHAQLERV